MKKKIDMSQQEGVFTEGKDSQWGAAVEGEGNWGPSRLDRSVRITTDEDTGDYAENLDGGLEVELINSSSGGDNYVASDDTWTRELPPQRARTGGGFEDMGDSMEPKNAPDEF